MITRQSETSRTINGKKVDQGFGVRSLTIENAAELSAMLLALPRDYARFFSPFEFSLDTVANVLSNQGDDVFIGLYWEDRIIGFFLLRGWNDGYEVPTFGIIIDKKYRGYELEMLSLDTAKIICRLRGAERLMLKMHPDNISAKGVMRKIGFIQIGVEPGSGNIIYHLEIGKRAASESNSQTNDR